MNENRQDSSNPFKSQKSLKQRRNHFQNFEENSFEEDVNAYKQEFEEILSQSQMSEGSQKDLNGLPLPSFQDFDEKDSNKSSQKSKNNGNNIQKYGYLVALVNKLQKMKEIEHELLDLKYQELKDKIVSNYMLMESQHDKCNREVREHKAIIESANVTKGVLLKS